MKIDKAYVDVLLKKYLPEKRDELYDVVTYALFSGGKRLRPLFLLKTADVLREVDENIERLAVALECIHTYSLIHDDLPSMDNDDLRRGKPTCHKAFGEAKAVLAGDWLLNFAAEIVAGGQYSPDYFRAAGTLFRAGGERGMIHGQMCDLNGAATEEALLDIAEHKTAKLFGAAFLCPAEYFGAENLLGTLTDLARSLGIAFQIADDLSDGGPFLSLGKTRCTTLLKKYIDDARTLCASLPFSAGYVTEFADLLEAAL